MNKMQLKEEIKLFVLNFMKKKNLKCIEELKDYYHCMAHQEGNIKNE